jgi:DNA replication protein DnaC
LRAQILAPSKQSLSPDGVLDWCFSANQQYQKATARIRDALISKANDYHEKGNSREAEHLERLSRSAALPTATLGALIVGPRRIGKSKLLTAIGLALHHRAMTADRQTMTIEAYEKLMRLASGLRCVNGIALARAAMDSGGWKNSALYHEACNASILLLDETGYEELKSDGTLLRDLLRMRYEPLYRPTVMVSAATIAELNDRYGEGAMSTVWERGLLADLHQYASKEVT